MSLPKSFPLKAANGKTIDLPAVGYGTWAAGDKSWAKDATLTALKAGYRHIDGAWMYSVDEQVGEAIRESGVPREEIFVTSKIWPHFYAPENVELCLDQVLSATQLDHVDLFLAHWPFAIQPVSRSALENAKRGADVSKADQGLLYKNGKPVFDWEHTSSPIAAKAGQESSGASFLPTWRAMQELVRKGKARAVGVSNFSIEDLTALLEATGHPANDEDIPISCNQVEVHPWLPQTELIEFARGKGILTTCYSPFAGQKSDGETLLQDPTVKKLAAKNGVDVGQLLQSWAVQRGTVPLGKSATPARIKSNLAVKKLPDEDFEALNGLAQPGDEGRTIRAEPWGLPLF